MLLARTFVCLSVAAISSCSADSLPTDTSSVRANPFVVPLDSVRVPNPGQPTGDSPPGGDDLIIRQGPELPRLSLDLSMPTSARTVRVRAGDDLQRALDRAQRGDELVLDAGASWRGNFVLPARPGSAANGWVVVRSSGAAQLRPAGSRVTPADAPSMARIMASGQAAAIATAPGASGWRLVGLEITQDSSYAAGPNNGIVLLGDGSRQQNALPLVARDLVLDRVYVHGWPGLQTKRCVALNSAATAIVDSHLGDCKGKGYDTQAIGGWNGPGPFLIQNNRLEGAGENVMFGGADPAIPDLIPSDITIRGNYFYKPRSWQGVFTVKNLFELKNAQRVLVEGNVLRNNWVDAQVGFAVVIGSVNQSGACAWCIVQDVTFRSNWIDSTAAAFNLFQGYAGSQLARRLALSHVVLTNVGVSGLGNNGRMFQVAGNLDDLTIEHTTGFAPYAYLQFVDQRAVPKARFVFRNNVGGNAMYNLQSPMANGEAMLARYTVSGVFLGNVIVGSIPRGLSAGNFNPPNMAALGFAGAAASDLAFGVSSPYFRGGANRETPGADVAAVMKMVSGIDR